MLGLTRKGQGHQQSKKNIKPRQKSKSIREKTYINVINKVEDGK